MHIGIHVVLKERQVIMRCFECGAENKEHEMFCIQCGSRLQVNQSHKNRRQRNEHSKKKISAARKPNTRKKSKGSVRKRKKKIEICLQWFQLL